MPRPTDVGSLQDNDSLAQDSLRLGTQAIPVVCKTKQLDTAAAAAGARQGESNNLHLLSALFSSISKIIVELSTPSSSIDPKDVLSDAAVTI